MNTSISFCDESLCSGKLVPSVPYFYLSIILFFILSFSHLPVRPVGYNLKRPGVAREAQLLVRGGVRSVRIFKAKLRKVIKGMDYPFVWVKKGIYHMIVKKRGGIAPPWSAQATQAKSVWDGALL